jgi:hypothetical protein
MRTIMPRRLQIALNMKMEIWRMFIKQSTMFWLMILQSVFSQPLLLAQFNALMNVYNDLGLS